MFEDLGQQNIINGEILGGKTGYTNEAGLCLASLAQMGKQEYILISTGAKGDYHSEQYNATDALAVYNSKKIISSSPEFIKIPAVTMICSTQPVLLKVRAAFLML